MTSEEVYNNQDELNSTIEETPEPIFANWGLKIVDIDLRTASEWEQDRVNLLTLLFGPS